MGLSVIILAAGNGTRMRSKNPKVLHKIANVPLLEHVIEAVKKIEPDEIFVVYGHMGEKVCNALAHCPVKWIEQKERLGTGHAVLQVLPYLKSDNKVLILYGDVPLISPDTLRHLVKTTGAKEMGLLAASVDNPSGLGRIVRDQYHQVVGIVEDKDATDLQRQIKEINTGIYCVPAKLLAKWLPKLKNNNAQGEYYLTDIIGMANDNEIGVDVSEPLDVKEILGANSRVELAQIESIYRSWRAQELMEQGVTIIDPARVDVRGKIKPAQDCVLDVNVVLEGNVELGEDGFIGPNVVLKNVKLGRRVEIKANSVVEDAIIGDNVVIGPFARVRPGTVLKDGSKVGNFVEIKKSTIGEGSKVNHLTYIGDSEIGCDVNIGAGTITCNYDGVNKHKTQINDNAFIGSNTALVAPVTIGKGATIGAGSVITRNVPADKLALTRPKQQVIEGWERPKKVVS